MAEAEETPIPGVRGMDHTADLGLEIRAPDLPELFRRAAFGAIWLVLERQLGQSGEGPFSSREGEIRSIDLAAEDHKALLRSWLRTILFWDETEGYVTVEARLLLLPASFRGSREGRPLRLCGEVVGRFDHGPRVREIKGVTLHGLCVEPMGDGWFGRVIFDV